MNPPSCQREEKGLRWLGWVVKAIEGESLGPVATLPFLHNRLHVASSFQPGHQRPEIKFCVTTWQGAPIVSAGPLHFSGTPPSPPPPPLPTPSSTGRPATLASLSSPWEDSRFVSVVICYLLLLISVLPEKQHRAMAPRARDSATGSTPFLICASTKEVRAKVGRPSLEEGQLPFGASGPRLWDGFAFGVSQLFTGTPFYRWGSGVLGRSQGSMEPPTMAEVAVFPPIR